MEVSAVKPGLTNEDTNLDALAIRVEQPKSLIELQHLT
jgi:hypothetical protein